MKIAVDEKKNYEKHSTIIRAEIKVLETDLSISCMKSSNFEIAAEKCLSMAQNLGQTWIAASFENKRRLQSIVFPEGIMYNKEKGVVRTSKINTLFSAIAPLVRVLAKKEKGNLAEDYLNSG